MALLTYKIGIMGCPSQPDVPWSAENLRLLQNLGFNAMQLNIAWGYRPADEVLNLEDVVELPNELHSTLGQPLPPRSDRSAEAWERRRSDLRHRIGLCREAGMHSIFHFGAPYNGGLGYTDQPLVNCLLDGRTPERYVALIDAFAREFPGVDDLLMYTYDQDAWLCNEFGPCERCRGIPLHERVVPFINRLADAWRAHNPEGRLWWEPWELSAGQVLQCIGTLDATRVGLMLHANIAEVMAALPVDRFVKNAVQRASARGIPVVMEGFFGAASEEVEPYRYLAYPLVTLREARALASVPGVVGLKEYFGLIPTKEDPNLRVTGLFFQNPGISDDEALAQLAEPYGPAAADVAAFWRRCSVAYELFPWDASWYIREVGKCDPRHSMHAAFIRGTVCHTPSWDSTRRAIFMKTDDEQPDPWLLEDVQLRCDLAAAEMAEALTLGVELRERVPDQFRRDFALGLEELDGWRRRTLSYAYHLRETNLATVMRRSHQEQQPVPQRLIDEMRATLKADQANQQVSEPIGAALALLDTSVDDFLASYFRVTVDDTRPRGPFTVTSR